MSCETRRIGLVRLTVRFKVIVAVFSASANGQAGGIWFSPIIAGVSAVGASLFPGTADSPAHPMASADSVSSNLVCIDHAFAAIFVGLLYFANPNVNRPAAGRAALAARQHDIPATI